MKRASSASNSAPARRPRSLADAAAKASSDSHHSSATPSYGGSMPPREVAIASLAGSSTRCDWV